MSASGKLALLALLLASHNSYGLQHDDHLTMMLSGFPATPSEAESSLTSTLLPQSRKSPDETQAEAVRNLLSRLLPSHASLFHVEVNSSLAVNGMDAVQVVSPLPDGTEGVSVTGSGGVAAAWGILNYLKYYCNCHISWEADQLDLPNPLPKADFAITAKDKARYYQNVCTVSYSSVWWDWPRWEREIDWMALNGINLPLAFTGQEAVWRRVFLKLGLVDEDLEHFFSGPAFLAWQRMGNLMAWGGPLPLSWIEAQEELQKKILNRMRELGITPVLPCFAGHIPGAFQRVYPDANVTRMSSWGGFNDTYTRTYMLEASDPMYSEIGAMFVEEMIDTYNYTDGFYNCDPFNEQTPASDSPEYISSVGTAIYGGLQAADPDAIWVMQAWMLLNSFWTLETARSLFTSVEQGRILTLDLAAVNYPLYDSFESFFGQPFVFCMLHNFGGTDGLNGFTGNIVKNLGTARTSNSTMVGTGLTMEGIDQNYIMYDLMMELAWKDIPDDVIAWARQYSTRRYGSSDVANAWDYLMPNIFNNTNPSMQFYHGDHALFLRPSLQSHLTIWYPMIDLVNAWDEMVAAANSSLAEEYALKNTLREVNKYLHIKEHLIVSSSVNKRRIAKKLEWERNNRENVKEESLVISKNLIDIGEDSTKVKPSMAAETDFDSNNTIVDLDGLQEYLGFLDQNRIQVYSEEEQSGIREPKSFLNEQKTFQHDLVDVSREVLQNLGAFVVEQMIQAYNNGSNSSYNSVLSKGDYLAELMVDLDDLLATSPDFLLGKWTKCAESWATTDEERELYVYNALNQVTLWGPEGHGPLDYANKQWSGMVSQYYLPRWEHFVKELLNSLDTGEPFDQGALNKFFLENIEKPFTFDVNREYPNEPIGDAVQTVLKIYRKYRPELESSGLFDMQKIGQRSEAGDAHPTAGPSPDTSAAESQGHISALHHRHL